MFDSYPLFFICSSMVEPSLVISQFSICSPGESSPVPSGTGLTLMYIPPLATFFLVFFTLLADHFQLSVVLFCFLSLYCLSSLFEIISQKIMCSFSFVMSKFTFDCCVDSQSSRYSCVSSAPVLQCLQCMLFLKDDDVFSFICFVILHLNINQVLALGRFIRLR